MQEALQTGEGVLALLGVQENPYLYLHKKIFEPAYRLQIYQVAAEQEPNPKLFSYLESLRKAEKRSLELNITASGKITASETVVTADARILERARRQFEEQEREFLEQHHRLLKRHNAALLYIQPTQRGVVWYLLPPDGPARQAISPLRLEQTLESIFLFLHRMPRLLARQPPVPSTLRTSPQAMALTTTAPDWEKLEQRLLQLGQDAWKLLSDSPEVMDWLHQYGNRLWISPQGYASRWPLEFLHTGSDWLGLQYLLPRISTLGELTEILNRHPRPGSCLVVGNPLHGADTSGLINAQRSAEKLHAGIGQLAPFPAHLLVQHQATSNHVCQRLNDQQLSLFLYSGHGSIQSGKAHLCLTGNDQLNAPQLRQFSWPNQPLIHLDCCLAGVGKYEGGGKLDGLTHAALTAGASEVIASNHAIGDTDASAFTEDFYGRWLSPTAPTLHDALLAARGELARHSRQDHLLWGLTVYHGNPHIRHPWHLKK